MSVDKIINSAERQVPNENETFTRRNLDALTRAISENPHALDWISDLTVVQKPTSCPLERYAVDKIISLNSNYDKYFLLKILRYSLAIRPNTSASELNALRSRVRELKAEIQDTYSRHRLPWYSGYVEEFDFLINSYTLTPHETNRFLGIPAPPLLHSFKHPNNINAYIYENSESNVIACLGPYRVDFDCEDWTLRYYWWFAQMISQISFETSHYPEISLYMSKTNLRFLMSFLITRNGFNLFYTYCENKSIDIASTPSPRDVDDFSCALLRFATNQHDHSAELLLSGDIETNPGPSFSRFFYPRANKSSGEENQEKLSFFDLAHVLDAIRRGGVDVRLHFSELESFNVPLLITTVINLYNASNYKVLFFGILTQYLLGLGCVQQLISKFLTWCTQTLRSFRRNRHSNETDSNGAVYNLIGGFFHLIFTKTLPSQNAMKQLGNWCRNINSIGSTAELLTQKLPRILTTIFEWLKYLIWGDNPDTVIAQYTDFNDEVNSFFVDRANGHYTVSEAKMKMQELFRRGESLGKMIDADLTRRNVKVIDSYKTCHSMITRQLVTTLPSARQTSRAVIPYLLTIYGDSQVGKSRILSSLIQWLSVADPVIMRENPTLNTDDYVYFRNISTQFFDAFDDRKHVMVYDDFAQQADTAGAPSVEFNEIIRLDNTVPTLAHMASLEDKGRFWLNPRLVVLTTNVLTVPTPSLKHPSALFNRLGESFWKINVDPDFLLDNKLNTAKVEQILPTDDYNEVLRKTFGHYSFERHYAKMVNNDTSLKSCGIKTDYLTFLNTIKEEYVAKMQLKKTDHSQLFSQCLRQQFVPPTPILLTRTNNEAGPSGLTPPQKTEPSLDEGNQETDSTEQPSPSRKNSRRSISSDSQEESDDEDETPLNPTTVIANAQMGQCDAIPSNNMLTFDTTTHINGHTSGFYNADDLNIPPGINFDTIHQAYLSVLKSTPEIENHVHEKHDVLSSWLYNHTTVTPPSLLSIQTTMMSCASCKTLSFLALRLWESSIPSKRKEPHGKSSIFRNIFSVLMSVLTTFLAASCVSACVTKFFSFLKSAFSYFTQTQAVPYDELYKKLIIHKIDRDYYFQFPTEVRFAHLIPSTLWSLDAYFNWKRVGQGIELSFKPDRTESSVYGYFTKWATQEPMVKVDTSLLSDPSSDEDSDKEEETIVKPTIATNEIVSSGDSNTPKSTKLAKLGIRATRTQTVREIYTDPQLSDAAKRAQCSLGRICVAGTSGRWVILGRFFAVGGRNMLTFAHVLPELEAHDKFFLTYPGWNNPLPVSVENVTVKLIQSPSVNGVPVDDIPPYKLGEHTAVTTLRKGVEYKDACILCIDSQDFPAMPKNFKSFIPREFVDKLVGPRAGMLVGAMFGGSSTDYLYQTLSDLTLNIKEEIHTENIVYSNGSVHAAPVIYAGDGLAYTAQSTLGDCGSLIMVQDKTIPNKICGLHAGGTPTGRCFGVVLCQEDIYNATECIATALQINMPAREISKTVIRAHTNIVGMPDGMIFLGNVDPVFSPNKTNLRESLIHNKLWTSKMAPARLTTLETPEEIINPKVKGVMKYEGLKIGGDPEKWKIAAQATYRFLLNSSTDSRSYCRVYSLNEAVFGIKGQDRWGALRTSTSLGYGWNNLGMTGKRAHIKNESGEEWISPELRDAIRKRVELMNEGTVPSTIYTDTLKDEKRSIEKVRTGATRVFASAPVDYNILVRMYFGGFIHWLLDNHVDNRLLPGINMYSPQSHRLATKLREFPNFMAGDFKNYDGSGNVRCMQAILKYLIEAFYEGSEGKKMREILFEDFVNSIHVCDDIIYLLLGGVPSGNPLTTTMNSLINLVMSVYVWREVVPDGYTTADYFEFTRSFFYGDDNVFSVSEVVKEFFNHETVAKQYALIGYTYTNSKKVKSTQKFDDWDEISILKRYLVFDPIINRYVARLELDTIHEMTNWIRSGPDLTDLERLMLNCDVAAREMSLYSPRQYEEFTTSVDKIMRSTCSKVPNFLEYKECRYQVLNSDKYHA